MDDDLVLKPTPKTKAIQRKGTGSDVHEDLLEFVLLAIKAAIHHFLFQRKVYPDRWFKSERVFLAHTQACRHPSVRDYISEAAGSIKESLSAGDVETVCIGLQFPGCAQHEMLCIHPSILLPPQTDTRPPWEDIDDALRSLLLQLHHLNCSMPPPKEGTVFRISIQTRNKAKLPDEEWAFVEDPVQSAIAATQALHSEQHSHADPPAATTLPHSTSGAGTAPIGSLHSPYVARDAEHPQHTAAGRDDGPASATGGALSGSPPRAAPAPTAVASLQDLHHTSGPQPHSLERTHDVGFGRSGAAQPSPCAWNSQQSVGVQSQTQQGPEKGSDSTERATGHPPGSHTLNKTPAEASQDEAAASGARKRPLPSPCAGAVDHPRKAVKRPGEGGPLLGSWMQRCGEGESPLLGSPTPINQASHGRESGKADTDSYGTAGCPTFQAAQIVPQIGAPEPSPAAAATGDTPIHVPGLAGSPVGSSTTSSSGDTLLQEASPVQQVTPSLQPLTGGVDAPRTIVSTPAGVGRHVDTESGLRAPWPREADGQIPAVDASANMPAASCSVVLTVAQGDTLVEPLRGEGVQERPKGGDEEATSPGDSLGVVAGDAAVAAVRAHEGSDHGGSHASAGGGSSWGGSQPAHVHGEQPVGGFPDGEPDFFADLLGSGPFRGFGQQVEPPASLSEPSDGQLVGSIRTDDAQPTASASGAEAVSSDVDKHGAALPSLDLPPAACVADMLLTPLVDSCVPGVLEIRANLLHLRPKPRGS